MQATALQVVRQHFGDHTEVICAALIRYPKRTLKELQGDTDIAVGQLRNCLLILLQHNLVTATVDTSKQRGAGQVLYSFNLEAAVLRLRYPKFVAHISKVLGEKDGVLGERILESVLDNGRASWEMIWGQIKDLSDEGVTADRAQKVGDLLVKSKYLVRVIPVSERVEPAAPEYTMPKKATAVGKRKAAGQLEEERESKVRKGIDMSIITSVKEESEGMTESIANAGAMWHVNPPAFLWDLRAIAIERVMTDRLGAATASLMKLLLRTVRAKSLQPNHIASCTVPAASVDAILATYRQSPSPEDIGIQVTWETLSDKLDSLCQDSFKCVTKLLAGGVDGATFKPDLHLLTGYLRQHIMERVMEKKFTPKGRRIFRLLLAHNYLESKAVWDLSMVPKKDANDLLCRMLKAQFVQMQEVPRSADHNAQRTFFLWFVDLSKVCFLVTDEMYRNMSLLLQKRDDRRRECEEFVGVGGEVEDLTADQHKQYQALEAQVREGGRGGRAGKR
jgi:DNA-directed RNA polymerase III subunit RPC3